MPTREEMIAEARKRGILPRGAALRHEAERRGLTVPAAPAAPAPAETPEPFPGSTMGATALGGMAGAAVGAPLGPLGLVAGGALGAGAGYLGKQNLDRALAAAGALPDVALPTTEEVLRRTASEMTADAALSGGAVAVGQLYRMGRRALGEWVATAEGRYLSQAAKRLGIGLGTADVTSSRMLRGYSKIVGRLPFFATPFREAEARKAGEVLAARENLLHRLGPSVGVAQAGVDLREGANEVFRAFRRAANEKYEAALKLADERTVVVPTDETRKALDEVAEDMAKRRPVTETGAPIEGGLHPAADFAAKYSKLSDKLTVRQYDGLLEDLDVAMRAAKEQGYDVRSLVHIKRAVEEDFARMAGDEEAVRLFREADDFYTRGMRTFETPTAQKIRRVERRPFRVGLSKPGALNEDELFRVMWNAKSSQAIRDLRELVGETAFQRAARTYIESAWDKAIVSAEKGKVFNPETFARTLGLHNPRSVEYQSLEESLRGGPLTTEDLQEFTRVVKAAFKEGVPDPSALVSRRIVLGGVRSGVRSLMPFTAATATSTGAGGIFGGPGGAAGALLATALARRGSTLLSRPVELRLLTDALDQATPAQMRNAAIARLIRLYPETVGREEDIGKAHEEQVYQPLYGE